MITYFNYSESVHPDDNVLCLFWLGELPVCGRIQDEMVVRETSEGGHGYVRFPVSMIDYWMPLPLPKEGTVTIKNDPLFTKK